MLLPLVVDVLRIASKGPTMPHRTTCACGQRLEFGDRRLGQFYTCPKCQTQLLLVPDGDGFAVGSDPEMRVFPLSKPQKKR